MSPIDTILQRAALGEYGEDSAAIGKLAGMVRAATFDKGFGPFICGTVGAEGTDGLHEGYIICPRYGADARLSAIFSRSDGQKEEGGLIWRP